ncbi:type VII toxin-antitoxin system HepT family RNase toxin [Brevibacillus sp. SYSU BS000544]|uniref:type VII toxin-antitoxin system HepT family RNase toxin n=1 Tax=Brevibacillus sp. SYSU BS000544 TaxID=3416443 RepID=UPI003CE56C07
MYDVNTGRIEDRLSYLEQMIAMLRELISLEDEKILASLRDILAMERALHLSIEAIVDVGNAMIDGFIMRDPGSYTDIVEILRDEQVIIDSLAHKLNHFVEFRKQLVNEYTQVPVAEMIQLVRSSIEDLPQFAPAVRAYIEKELF